MSTGVEAGALPSKAPAFGPTDGASVRRHNRKIG
jgi:hypothetical protein